MLSERPLNELLEQIGSTAPAPGAGPSAAWTGALAAALVEMVSGVELQRDGADAAAARGRRDRAVALREQVLALAEDDVHAYTQVLDVLRHRDEPGHGQRLRAALSNAANPPLEIARVAGEITSLAADAVASARGGVRGEAMTAAVLGEAAVRAASSLVTINLASDADDPRRTLVGELAGAAQDDLRRAHEHPRTGPARPAAGAG